jgi:hypothetical protein
LEEIVHTSKYKKFGDMIHPYLVKNRVRARAQAVAAEARQGKRWALLGSALRHSSVRSNPMAMFAFLRTNADTVVANAPSGKEVLVRQLEKLDRQRAAVLGRIREYEELEKLTSASRKRSRAPEGGVPSGARKKARS